MTAIEEQTRTSFLQYQLKKERRRMSVANRKVTSLNKRVTVLRRAYEDRQLARELNCAVSDFA